MWREFKYAHLRGTGAWQADTPDCHRWRCIFLVPAYLDHDDLLAASSRHFTYFIPVPRQRDEYYLITQRRSSSVAKLTCPFIITTIATASPPT